MRLCHGKWRTERACRKEARLQRLSLQTAMLAADACIYEACSALSLPANRTWFARKRSLTLAIVQQQRINRKTGTPPPQTMTQSDAGHVCLACSLTHAYPPNSAELTRYCSRGSELANHASVRAVKYISYMQSAPHSTQVYVKHAFSCAREGQRCERC